MNWKYLSEQKNGQLRGWLRQPDGLMIRQKSAKRFVLEDVKGKTLSGEYPSLAAAQEYADRNIAPTV